MARKKIGLALGGGGPKGLAHIGVIKILRKNNIPIDYIAGTSIGALVGGFYAYSQQIEAVENYILTQNWLQTLSYFVDPSLKGGLVQGNRLEQFLDGFLLHATFDDLKVPFQASAVDLHSGHLAHLQSGSLCRAIRASCAAPILFKPVEIDSHFYLDGGLISSVPVEMVKKMGADIVIAVQLNKFYKPKENIPSLSIPEVGELALNIIEGRIAKEEVTHADIVISPSVSDINWDDLLIGNRKKFGITLGEQAAEEVLPAIQQTLKNSSTVNTVGGWIDKIRSLFH